MLTIVMAVNSIVPRHGMTVSYCNDKFRLLQIEIKVKFLKFKLLEEMF